jgi:uncharacterized membrane protein YfcA
MTLLIIFIISYVAFSLSAFCGGGAGLILIPVLTRLLPVNQVPVALSIGTFTSSGSRLLVFYKHIRWHIVKYFLPPAICAVWLGAFLLKYVNPVYLQIVLGIFLIGNLRPLFKKRPVTASINEPGNLVLMIAGFLAGFLSGLTGAVGLLFNKLYLDHGLNKEEILATRAANEIALHVIKIILYACFGLLTSKVISVGLAVALSALLSTWTMKWILPYLSVNIFRKAGYTAMVVSGLVMLAQSGKSALEMNKAELSSRVVAEGAEAKLTWNDAGYSLEFAYDDGFELEQVIPFDSLTAAQKQLIKAQQPVCDKIIVENVYKFGSTSHEAYFFNRQQLVKKIDF